MDYLESVGIKAKKASVGLKGLTEEQINQILIAVANKIKEEREYIKSQNDLDILNAQNKGLGDAFIDRLKLTDKVIDGIAEGIESLTKLSSPVGKIVYDYKNEYQGIDVQKINVPFGVIGIIYESRPNVTADAFSLCFKTKNAVVLRGGSDSINSNLAIAKVIKASLAECGVDKNAINVLEDTSRETATMFMKLDKYIDLLIPRGGASLIKNAIENATVPIIETGTGNCHIYIDYNADIQMSAEIVFNAKTQRYSVCNACESLVIHKDIISTALPIIATKLKEKQVVIRADESAFDVIKDYPYLERATEEDFFTEYGKAMISVKTVDDVDSAIEHVNLHSTGHSESIITNDDENAKKFLEYIDSSSVYHNASTRFSDGFVFGLGAEIGISTQKLHARGPMGLDALVTTKYIVKGDGAIRK